MSIKTLLVDDDSSLLDQAEVFLEKEDHDIELFTSSSVEKALEMLDEEDFDMVVSDYQMFEMDGIEFLKVLREERDDDIPFIMLTGKGKEEIAMKALNLGANRYLQKAGEPKPWYNILAKAINEEVKQFKAEKRMLESEERYRRLFESAQEGILILDAETGKIEDANPYLLDLLGYSEEELVGKGFWKIDTFMKIAGTRNELKELLDEDHMYYKDIHLATKTGENIPVEIEINTYQAGGKKVVQFKIIDISGRKHKESLQEAVMRFRKLSESSPNAIILVDNKTGTIKDVNQVAEELLNMERKDIIGKEYIDFHPEEEKREIREIREIREVLSQDEEDESKKYSKELHIQDSDHKKIPVEMRTSSLVLGDEEIIYFVLNDISKRKEAERRLKENKEKIESLHEISAELQTYDSKQEVYNFVVEVAEDILDLEVCEISIPENDRMKGIARSSSFPEEASSELNPLPIEDSIAGKTYLENESFLVNDAEKNEQANPSVKRFKSGISVPIGDYAVFQGLSTEKNHFDEKDLRLAELLMRHVNLALERIKANESEEFLHSLLRHDLRNKIHISKGNLDLLKESGLPEEKIEFLDDGLESLKEGMDIIEKVRNLKKLGKDEVKEVLIGGILKRSVDQYRSEARSKGIEIELNMNDMNEKVNGGELLPEVFSNLISNSIRHSYGDKIVVSVEEEDEDDVICRVEDNGNGIPSEKKDEIFEKGFTTVNSSSGLGLYLVRDIVEHYGGSVEVKDSELGGARFDVRLQKV